VFSRPRRVSNRGAKKKALAKLDELPQGTIPLEPLALEEQEPTLPTVLLQARSNMRKFENCVLLTRVGGFYELYFEHADEFGPLLNLKVAPKSTGPRTNPVIVSMVSYAFSDLFNIGTNSRIGWLPILSAGQISQDSCSRFESLCCYC
jgi:hypothetical protein